MAKLQRFLGLSILLVALLNTATSVAEAKYGGTAINASALNSDPKYRDIATKYFEVLTPENEMKWGVVERTQGKVDTSGADALLDFAKKHGKKIRGHTILADTQNPTWASSLSGDTLKKAAYSYMELIFSRYGKEMISIDVCNEILGNNGIGLNGFWLSHWGNDFVVEIYRKARQLAGRYNNKIKLFINDFGIEGATTKSNTMLSLATKLYKMKLLDGVGFQCHFEVGKIPQDFQKNMKRFTDVGLYVAISELDIRIKQGRSQDQMTSDRKTQQRNFIEVFQVCLNNPKCLGVTVWGIIDTLSWIPHNPGTYGYGEALLFDANYKSKPAFEKFVQSFPIRRQ